MTIRKHALAIIATLAVALLQPATAHAQTSGGGQAFSLRNGAVDPAACQPSVLNVFYNRTSAALKICSATNTWSAIGGGSFPLQGTAGSAAAPTYGFGGASDSNTGMFRSAADAIGFSTGGVERWVINASGALNPSIDNTYDLGNGVVSPRDVNIARNLNLWNDTSMVVFTGGRLQWADGDNLTLTDGFSGFSLIVNGPASFTASRTVTWPDASGTVTLGGNTFSGTGSVLRATSPTLATPTLSGARFAVATKTADYTVTTADAILVGDATSGNLTFTLPTASAAFVSSAGSCYRFKRADGSVNTMTIAAAGADTIDGAASTTLVTQYAAKEICAFSTSTWGVF